MAFVQVIGMFDDPAALQRARSALIASGLVAPTAMLVEPADPLEDPHVPRTLAKWLERLEELMPRESQESRAAYAEGLRRGGQLLIATVIEEDAAEVRRVMREHGAVDMERRVEPRSPTGSLGFELPPPLPERIIEEPEPAPAVCVDERAAAPDEDSEDPRRPRDIRLFDEATGREIGLISEEELKVLQDALEEEDPDDRDYWINPAEVDDLACRPGATPHLISLLRAAVGDNPDGIDIAFQRDGQPRERLRGAAGPSRGSD